MNKFKIFTIVMIAEMMKERFPIGKGLPSEIDVKEMMVEVKRRWKELNHSEIIAFNHMFELMKNMDTKDLENLFKKEF